METTIDNCTDIKKYDEELFVLVEFPEDSAHFENEDIGFPCCFSEDNGARYVPIYDYLEHFRKAPQPKQLYKAVVWPQWQTLEPNERWELIIEEKALACFGSSAYWIPNELLTTKQQ